MVINRKGSGTNRDYAGHVLAMKRQIETRDVKSFTQDEVDSLKASLESKEEKVKAAGCPECGGGGTRNGTYIVCRECGLTLWKIIKLIPSD